MSELDMLQQRQELLEQAARLQRATIVVRLHKMQQNRWSLLSTSAWQCVERMLPAASPLRMAWNVLSWFRRRKT